MKRTPLLMVGAAVAVLVVGGIAVIRGGAPGGAPLSRGDLTSGGVTAGASKTSAAKQTSSPAQAGRAAGSDRLLVSESNGGETAVVSVSAANPADRRRLLRIEHAPNWAPRISVAPGGSLVAYTMLAAGAASPDTDGVLWMVDLAARQPRRLGARVDLRVAPLWAPDGSHLVYQRALTGGADGAVTVLDEVDVRDGKAQELAQAKPGRIFPVGYAPDSARFWYVRFERDGAYLHELNTRTRAARQVARLCDGAARDFKLAPAGDSLLYLAATGSPSRYRAMQVDLRGGGVQPLLPDVGRSEDVGIAWRDGAPARASLGYLPADGAHGGRVVLSGGRTVQERAQGFDVPVDWSADGRFLVVRAFSGATADNPGREQLALVDIEGVRVTLAGEGKLEFIGWVEHAP